MKRQNSEDDLMPLAGMISSNGLSFTILTVQSCSEFSWCHDRQPVILPSASATWQWLSNGPIDACGSLLVAWKDLLWHKVHPQVGSIKNNDPTCIMRYGVSDINKETPTLLPTFEKG